MTRYALVAFLVITGLSVQEPATIISPTAVVITVDDPDNVSAFRLALYTDLSTTTLPTGSAVAEVTVPKPAQTSVGVYTLPLAELLSKVGPPQRLVPLMLWETSVNAGGGIGPYKTASNPLVITAVPHVAISVVLQR